MGRTVESKAVELMDKAANGLDVLTVKLAEVGAQYGPDVVDAGLAVAQVSAAQNLLLAVPFLLGSAYLFYLSRGLWGKHNERPYESWEIGSVFAGIGGTFAGIIASIELFDIWNWVGIFEPKLWIAHRILGW